jgi:hypothetical protein
VEYRISPIKANMVPLHEHFDYFLLFKYVTKQIVSATKLHQHRPDNNAMPSIDENEA